MLPPAHRMHRSADFTSAVRGGERSGGRHLVVHHRRDLHPSNSPALVGLVVSKAVGGSVIRHRVSRRLRAVLAERVATLPAGSATVVRALPASAGASSSQLAVEVDRAFARQAARR